MLARADIVIARLLGADEATMILSLSMSGNEEIESEKC